MAGKSVSRGRAFRAGSCTREKALPSMATPAARPDRPRLTVAEGPGEAGAYPARQKHCANRYYLQRNATICDYLFPAPFLIRARQVLNPYITSESTGTGVVHYG